MWYCNCNFNTTQAMSVDITLFSIYFTGDCKSNKDCADDETCKEAFCKKSALARAKKDSPKETCPSKLCFAEELLVKFEGEVDEKHGQYFRGLWKYAGTSGGMSYWKRGNEAFWFAEQRWNMAHKDNLGKTHNSGVRSTVLEGKLCPTSACIQWEYYYNTDTKSLGLQNAIQKADIGNVNITAYKGTLRR